MNPSTGIPSASSAYQQLQSFGSGVPSAEGYLNQANNQYNVGGATSAVNNLQSLVGNLTNAAAAVAPSVQGLTSGTFTTAAQQQALINKEQQPIIANLSNQQQALGQAQSQQSNAENMANQLASNMSAQDQ